MDLLVMIQNPIIAALVDHRVLNVSTFPPTCTGAILNRDK